jgi:hypothetical protein
MFKMVWTVLPRPMRLVTGEAETDLFSVGGTGVELAAEMREKSTCEWKETGREAAATWRAEAWTMVRDNDRRSRPVGIRSRSEKRVKCRREDGETNALEALEPKSAPDAGSQAEADAEAVDEAEAAAAAGETGRRGANGRSFSWEGGAEMGRLDRSVAKDPPPKGDAAREPVAVLAATGSRPLAATGRAAREVPSGSNEAKAPSEGEGANTGENGLSPRAGEGPRLDG